MKRLLLLLPLMTILAYIAGAQSVPNPDFENWSAGSFTEPDSNWYTSNTQCMARLGVRNDTSITGANSTPHGIVLQTMISNGDTQYAYISNTPFNPFTEQGGRPYTSVVTQLTGYFKNYEYQNNDTSILIVYFKKAGVTISRDTLHFFGSNSSWTQFTKNLHLNSQVPDSVIIAAISSNVLLHQGIGPSWLALDELQFLGSSSVQAIVGGTFDGASKSIATNTPNNWHSEGGGLFSTGVSSTNNAQHGSLAIKLVTQNSGGGQGGAFPAPAAVTSGMPVSSFGTLPFTGIPYSYPTADTLIGYFLYTPVGNDTGAITVTLIKNGLPVGIPHQILLTSVGSYTQFKLGWGTPTATPDSIRIDIASSNMFPKPGSTLIVDNWGLKSQGGPIAVHNVYVSTNNIIVYPNPASDVLNIRFNAAASGNVNVRIYDMTGKTLVEREYGNTNSILNIPVSQLSSGMYFYEVRDNVSVNRNKFIKQ